MVQIGHEIPQVLVVVIWLHWEHVQCFWLVRSHTFARSKVDIDCQSQRIVDHPWQQLLKVGIGLLKARIGVDLDQPRVQVFSDNKVVAKQFKAALVHFKLVLDCLQGDNNNVL